MEEGESKRAHPEDTNIEARELVKLARDLYEEANHSKPCSEGLRQIYTEERQAEWPHKNIEWQLQQV